MYPQFSSEVARQRRQAFTAVADRRRSFGRRARRVGAGHAADVTPLAHLVELPVRPDGRRGDGPVASIARPDARVA